MGYIKPHTWAKIESSIYLTGQAAQTDLLTNLPAELAQMVWDNIEDDTDKTTFALTCKANAEFHDSLNKPKRMQAHSKLQKVSFMKRIRGFAGTGKSRLCFKCTKYMPVRGVWGGLSAYDKLEPDEVRQEHLVPGPRCPHCTARDKKEQKQYVKYKAEKCGSMVDRKTLRKGACNLARQRARKTRQ